jgi:membrane protease YdiL (CAAX protease family)
MAIVVVGESLVAYLVGAQLPVTDSLLGVGGPIGLLVLLIGGCDAGPIVEEFVVRASCFAVGRSHSLAVLTSAVWAISHTQYNWFGRVEVFVIGLTLGHFRWRGDSTWLTVMVHSGLNLVIFFGMGPYV